MFRNRKQNILQKESLVIQASTSTWIEMRLTYMLKEIPIINLQHVAKNVSTIILIIIVKHLINQ